MPAGSDFAAAKSRRPTHSGLADNSGGYRAWNKDICIRRYETGLESDPSPSMLHKMYVRGIFTGTNRDMQYTGLTIVDVETAAHDVHIAIISYYEWVQTAWVPIVKSQAYAIRT